MRRSAFDMTSNPTYSPPRGSYPIYHGHAYPTPPLTPSTPAISSPLRLSTTASQYHTELEDFTLPPPMSPSNFGLEPDTLTSEEQARLALEAEQHVWSPELSPERKEARSEWLSKGRGRKGLRIVIVTGELRCWNKGPADGRKLLTESRWSDENAGEAA